MSTNSRLVYSDELGNQCPKCRKPLKQCRCQEQKKTAASAAPPNDGVVRIQRQTKGRKGNGVTLITGVPLAGEELKALAKQLKQRCGTGGTVKDGVIEIQGDQRDLLKQLLDEKGWKVKLAGG